MVTFFTPHATLSILLIVQFLIYLDRGIIPGSIGEVNTFIAAALKTSRPNFYLGLLQSSFVIGLSISCPIISHYSHLFSCYILIAIGIATWMVGAWIAGFSYYTGYYTMLLVGRIISGVGEASLISLVPPLIMKQAGGQSVGFWMGGFCAMIPIGTASGYWFGSLFATSTKGWGTAFVIEAFLGLPFILIFLMMSPSVPSTSGISPTGSVSFATLPNSDFHEVSDEDVDHPHGGKRRLSVYQADGVGNAAEGTHEHFHRLYLPKENSSRPSSSRVTLDSQCRTTKDELANLTGYRPDDSRKLQSRSTSFSALPDVDRPFYSQSSDARLGGCYVSFTKSSWKESLHSDQDSDDGKSRMTPDERLTIEQDEFRRNAGCTRPDVSSDHEHLSFLQDMQGVLASVPFRWLAVAYSAYSATVIALSTFGGAFLVDLGFLADEVKASASMGLVVAISGIVGGLAGGCLVSIARKKTEWRQEIQQGIQSSDEVYDSQLRTEVEGAWPEVVDARSRMDLLHPLQPAAVETSGLKVGSGLEDGADLHRFTELSDLLDVMIPVLIISVAVLCMSPFFHSLWSFLVFTGTGLVGLFSAQSGLNIATMLSVPLPQRSCSIAMITLILHLTGDVPSPIIVGLIKDSLAPHCTSASTSSSIFTTPLNNQTTLPRYYTISPELFPQAITTVMPIHNVTSSDYYLVGMADVGVDSDTQPTHWANNFPSENYSRVAVTEFDVNVQNSLKIPTCRDESIGIRETIFLATIWLGWMVIGVVNAKQAAQASLEGSTRTR